MKKLFLFIFCFVTLFCRAQYQTSLQIRTPKQFGAKGDSVTDDVAAFRTCAASFGINGGIMQIGPGKWVCNDSVIIPKNVQVIGSGGNSTNDSVANRSGNPTTTIISRSSTHSVFVTQADDGSSGIQFRDMLIKNESGSTPTAGSAIVVRNGGDFRIEGCTIQGFFINVYVVRGLFWNMHYSHLTSPVKYDLFIDQTYSSDEGDFTISDCEFTSGSTYTHPIAGIYWKGSGGFKMDNCKFVFVSVDTSKTFYYCLNIDNLNLSPSDIIISNTSFEGFDSCAITAQFPSTFRHMNISNVQTETYFSAVAPAIRINFGTTGTTNGLVTIDNVNAMNYPQGAITAQPCVQVTNGSYIYLGQIIGAGYSKPWNLINCFNSNYQYSTDATIYPHTNFYSYGAVRIISDSGHVSDGKDPIIFYQGGAGIGGGINPEKMRIDSNGRVLIGVGLAQNLAGGTYTNFEVYKDTSAQFRVWIINPNVAAGAGAVLAFGNGVQNGYLELISSGASVYKASSANNVGLYSASDIFLQSDGGTVKFGNAAGLVSTISTTSHFLWQTTTDSSASIHIGAGSTTQAPLKFTAGSVLTTPKNGAFEYNGTHFYGTTGGTRYQLDLRGIDDVLGLGQALTANRTLDASTFILSVTGSSSTNTTSIANTNGAPAISATSTGNAIVGTSTLNSGVYGTAPDGVGVTAISTNNVGLSANSTGGVGAIISITPSSTNTIATMARFNRESSGTPANGLGGSIDLQLNSTTTPDRLANQIISAWTTAADATRTSKLSFRGVLSGTTTGDILSLAADGTFTTTGAKVDNIVTTGAGTYTILATDFTVVATGTTSTWTFPTAVTGRRLNLVNHGSGAITYGTAITTANGTTTTTSAAGNKDQIQYDGTVWRKIN